MDFEPPGDLKDWTPELFARAVKEEGGGGWGHVATDLVRRGYDPLEVVQSITSDDLFGVAQGLATEYDSTTAPIVEALLDAILTRVDVNATSDNYEVWNEEPEQTRTLLGGMAGALKPELVHFLLRRGADPLVSRAEALGAAFHDLGGRKYWWQPTERQKAVHKVKQIVVLLLQYGLPPRVLRRDQVQYLFADVGGLALLRLPASIWKQLPGLDTTPLRAAKGALSMALGSTLASYLAAAF